MQDVDVDFAFLPGFWENGFASESATAVMAYAQDAWGLSRVVAVTTPENQASIRMLEKLGMNFDRLVQLAEDGPELSLYARDF